MAVVLLVVIPIVSMVSIDSIKYERLAWNALENYVDVITDKGSITVDDFDKFVQKLGTTGRDWTITIQQEARRVYTTGTEGESNVKYITMGVWRSDAGNITQIHNCNKGDIITVTIEAINVRKSEAVVRKLLKVWKPNDVLTLSGMCRNDGGEV